MDPTLICALMLLGVIAPDPHINCPVADHINAGVTNDHALPRAPPIWGDIKVGRGGGLDLALTPAMPSCDGPFGSQGNPC
jgi:hypothetical protein